MSMTVTSDSARFEFGANWSRFVQVITPDRIREAEASLRAMLETDSLAGRTFLDIGCGSGLFSLAARRLGARVHSFDYDPLSVDCASQLRARHFPADAEWSVEQGSVLDPGYMASLGRFDVVYSWGVLHHTGEMWRGIDAAVGAVAPDGRLFIAIYNDQGPVSAFWLRVKRLYNRLPGPLRTLYLLVFGGLLELAAVAAALVRLEPGRLIRRWTRYESVRGMSRWHDVVDWIGGFPFEVAKPEEILDRVRSQGFELVRLTTCGGRMGCNEFVFHERFAGVHGPTE
jgi:2-polyprenyl-6-hydroxyphenyl methylase/3-demethylubiquinone-9 3-methyltransferase